MVPNHLNKLTPWPKIAAGHGADAATHWDHIQLQPLQHCATQQGHGPAPNVAFLRGVDAAVERHQICGKLQPVQAKGVDMRISLDLGKKNIWQN